MNQAATATTRLLPKPSGTGTRPHLHQLQILRYLAELQIIGFHFYSNASSQEVANFNQWGNTGLTSFFILSGFVLTYQYAHSPLRLNGFDFLFKRWAGLYPLYLCSLVLGFGLLRTNADNESTPLGLALVMTFGISKFIPSAFINSVNTPGWSVLPFLILYGIFPYCLRLLQALPSRFRFYVMPLLLYMASLAEPLLGIGLNTGILHIFTRMIAICSIANFLQGINLALIYFDWSASSASTTQPLFIHRCGASIAILLIIYISWFVPIDILPVWMNRWRDHGLFAPLHCILIFYTARDEDYICWIFKKRALVYLGNLAYGAYLFQALVWNYLVIQGTSPPAYIYIPVLTAVAALMTSWVQSVYTATVFTTIKDTLAKGTCQQAIVRSASLIASLLRSHICLEVIVLSFIPLYMAYINTQPCLPLECTYQSWMNGAYPPTLSMRRWFNHIDWNWTVNHWTLPCQPGGILSKGLARAATMSLVGFTAFALPAMGAAVAAILKRKDCHHKQHLVENSPIIIISQHKTSDEHHDGVIASRQPLSNRVVIRLLVPDIFPDHLVGPVIAHNRALLLCHVKHGYRFELDVLGVGHAPPSLPTLNDDAVRVTYRIDPRIHEPTVEDLIRLARERAAMEQHCDEEATIIYMLAQSRFTSVGLYRLLQFNAMRVHDGERKEEEPVGLLATELDGSDDLTPTIFSLAELNPLGPRARMAMCPSIAVTTSQSDRASICPASCLAEALMHGGTTSSALSPFAPIANLPATLPRALLGSGYGTTCSIDLPVPPAYAFSPSLLDHVSARKRMIRLIIQRMEIPRLVLCVSEMAWHLAFIFSSLLIVGTPIHEHYVEAEYLSQGLGYDCSDGHGTGLRKHRHFFAGLAAIYTAAYLFNFLRVINPLDGPFRFMILTFLMLLLLPIAAFLEACAITQGLTEAFKEVMFTKLWFESGMVMVRGMPDRLGGQGGERGKRGSGIGKQRAYDQEAERAPLLFCTEI